MIKIKTYTKNKNSSGGSSVSVNSTQTIINNTTNEWFEFDNDNNAVRCKNSLNVNGDLNCTGLLNGLTQEEIRKLIALADVMFWTGDIISIPSSIVMNRP